MKLWKLSLAALALASLAGAADACIQVYPYSELCRGNVEGFVRGLLP
ncbi:MAG TPA: hypothetical protein VM582_06365 [Candidatus Thermoplasmatota archaeon]|nr:hypothetical protein [Candidatus Thermoplasmatota archaeon]